MISIGQFGLAPFFRLAKLLPWKMRLQVLLAISFSCSAVFIDILVLDVLRVYSSNTECIQCIFLTGDSLVKNNIYVVIAIPILHLFVRAFAIFSIGYVSYNIGFFYSMDVLRLFAAAKFGGLTHAQVDAVKSTVEGKSIIFAQRFVGGSMTVVWASVTIVFLMYFLFGLINHSDGELMEFFVFIGFVHVFLSVISRRLAKGISRSTPKALDGVNTNVNKFSNGFVEFKFFGGEDFLLKKICNHLATLKNNLAVLDILGVLPKYTLESLLVLVTLFYISISGIQELSILDLSTYGAVGYLLIRILPLVQLVNQGLVNVAGTMTLYHDTERLRGYAIKAKNVQNKSNIFSGLSANNYYLNLVVGQQNLELTIGDVVNIVGPSASGKSTIMKGLAGLSKLENFEVTDGKGREIFIYNNINWASIVSYLSQSPELIFDRVNAHFKAEDLAICLTYAEILNVRHLFIENRLVNELSGGEKRKVAVIRNLVKPSLIRIFDEPCAGLDQRSVLNLKELMNEARKTSLIFYSSHNKRLNFENVITLDAASWKTLSI